MTADTTQEVKDRKNHLRIFLEDCFSEYQRSAIMQGRRRPTQSSFVRWLGVHPTNYSGWITMDRLPSGDNADMLATKLGQEIYEIVGIPPRMPKDKKLDTIARRWHQLSDQQKAALAEEVVNLTDDLSKNKNSSPARA